MTASLLHQVDVSVSRHGYVQRRGFLRAIPAAAVAASALSWTDRISLQADELRKRGMACIVLWMQGGPSQFETFSPKPDHANGGETKAISTSVSGVQIAESLPHLAQSMNDLCLLRSVHSSEGSHPRGTYLMHTGYVPTASLRHPTLGSLVSQQLGNAQFDLPNFVRIGQGRNNSAGAGFLGVRHDPFSISNPLRVPDNTTLASSEARYLRRLRLLGNLESNYETSGGRQEVEDHRQLYEKTARMILSPKMQAFDLSREPRAMREAYGSSSFASGCLLARRLIETGVTFVEVSAGNWDTHQDNFTRTTDLCQQIDQPFAQLVSDLKQRGMLEKTLVVWMGEFGRTPRVNPRGGRDHYPRAFNVALAGGGVRGGQVIGATDPSGSSVSDRPVGVADLLRTICHSLKVDADSENMSPIGRPIKVVDGGESVEEVFA